MHDRAVLRAQEALGDRVVEHRGEPVVVAAHVEQAARLGVQAELGPGRDLEELLERPEAAGQRHERVRQLGHLRLALVHRVDDPQVAQPGVGDLAVDQRLRDHADHLGAGRERRVGHDAHQADVGAAVDDAEPALGELRRRARPRPRGRPGRDRGSSRSRRTRAASGGPGYASAQTAAHAAGDLEVLARLHDQRRGRRAAAPISSSRGAPLRSASSATPRNAEPVGGAGAHRRRCARRRRR